MRRSSQQGISGPYAGTPFDFRQSHTIGERINSSDEQMKFGGGYDHNFVVNGAAGTLRPAARVLEPKSGRVMEVLTTEPGVQFYSGNFLDGSNKGKGRQAYEPPVWVLPGDPAFPRFSRTIRSSRVPL